jgi:hypothetical protein
MIYKVLYGTKEKVFSCIGKARAFRDKKRKKYSDVTLRVTQEDVDPSNKIAGVSFSEALDKLTNLKL